jgi:hypothetical protein
MGSVCNYRTGGCWCWKLDCLRNQSDPQSGRKGCWSKKLVRWRGTRRALEKSMEYGGLHCTLSTMNMIMITLFPGILSWVSSSAGLVGCQAFVTWYGQPR